MKVGFSKQNFLGGLGRINPPPAKFLSCVHMFEICRVLLEAISAPTHPPLKWDCEVIQMPREFESLVLDI